MTAITLEALRLRETELELDAVLIRGRILEVRANIEELQRRRGGRPRKPAEACSERGAAVSIIPQRVAGGIADTETDEQLSPEDAA